MKKILLLFLIIITSCDCNCPPSPSQEGTISQENNSVKKLEDYAWFIQELEYDSCEYILVNKGITHKGNCKYCEERKKKNEKDSPNNSSFFNY
jgi:hypothetical protein